MGGDGIVKNNFEIFNETSYSLSEDIKELEKFIDYVLNYEKLENTEFNIIFIDDKQIQEINKSYRGIDSATDVISFALEDDKMIELEVRLLGDIYISIDKAKGQAKDYGHSFRRELSFLALHGLLHLLGYDHMDSKDEEIMFKKQEEILNNYGIKREE